MTVSSRHGSSRSSKLRAHIFTREHKDQVCVHAHALAFAQTHTEWGWGGGENELEIG